jgi:hypothetical protein
MDDSARSAFLIGCLLGKDTVGLAGTDSRSDDAECDQFFQFATLHRMAPLLYSQIKKWRLDSAAPEHVLKKIRSVYLHNAARNTRLYNMLAEVLSVLRKAEIPVIVLKGAFLAEEVYGNIAARPMYDIDLLMKKEHLSNAVGELEKIGHRYGEYPNTDVHTRNDAILSIFDDGKEFPIDVHVAFEHGRISMEMEGIWRRAQRVSIAGEQAQALSPIDLLCHLCFHAGYQHGFSPGLLPLYDFYLSAKKYQERIDWDALWVQARGHGIFRGMLLMTRLMADLFGLALPGPGSGEESSPEFQRVLDEAKNFVVTGRRSVSPFSSEFAELAGNTGFAAKAQAVFRSVFLPKQALSLLYSCPVDSLVLYLYYFVRVKDLINRYGSAAFRGIVRRDVKISSWARQEQERMRLKSWMENSDPIL